LIVLVVSGDVCTFLLDTGLLFEDFFHRIAGLLVPIFAFFTFYSLLVIVFATFYRIIDRFSEAAQFLVHGQPKALTFTESLYFSIITLSAVGYGEVVPITSLVRGIVAVEIICGVMLLLFGFSEIIRFSREHPRRRE
jgi:voltage-gated potassium channel